MVRLAVLLSSSLIFVALAEPCTLQAQESVEARDSALRSVEYLAQAMDEFHTRFPVYDDISSAGNHFHARAKLPDAAAPVTINGSDESAPHSGATAIRNELRTGGGPYGGFLFLNGTLKDQQRAPLLNFGTVDGAGVDLTHATRLRFWARGAVGGERIQFFLGGTGWNVDADPPVRTATHPDSTSRYPASRKPYALTTEWQEIVIDLGDIDRHYILNGFGWVASLADNPNGAVFYLDDIQYDLDDAGRVTRLAEPRFIRSFTTEPHQRLCEPVGDFDLVLRNVAFSYDNAVALLAFLAIGSPDGLQRARLIGDAFVYAAANDRSYDDGRVRDAYAGGDLMLPPGWEPNGRIGTVPVSGFYKEDEQKFVEIEQAGVSTGNNAWVMMALLNLYRRTHDPDYLTTAQRIAAFVRTFKASDGTYRGFRGGLDNPEVTPAPTPPPRVWASTEHNLDLVAAFALLGQSADDVAATADSEYARALVEKVFDADSGCYLAGTLDPEHVNANSDQLPVDTQTWTILALPETAARHQRTLACARRRHQCLDVLSGFAGFDFNADRDGVWFEGTAHLATALAFSNDPGELEWLRATLRRAQATSPWGDGEGIVAASHDVVSTGFLTPTGDVFDLFQRRHVGATAWNVFAQLAFNPFYGSYRCDADASGDVTVSDGVQALRAAAELTSSCPPIICDADRSGSIGVSDGVQILRRAAGLSSTCLPGSGSSEPIVVPSPCAMPTPQPCAGKNP